MGPTTLRRLAEHKRVKTNGVKCLQVSLIPHSSRRNEDATRNNEGGEVREPHHRGRREQGAARGPGLGAGMSHMHTVCADHVTLSTATEGLPLSAHSGWPEVQPGWHRPPHILGRGRCPPAGMPRQALRADAGQGARFSSDALFLGILVRGHWASLRPGAQGEDSGGKGRPGPGAMPLGKAKARERGIISPKPFPPETDQVRHGEPGSCAGHSFTHIHGEDT